MARTVYFRDQSAPASTVIRPTAFAVVRDADRILLVQRCDDGLWELPGGGVDLGESCVDAVVREVAEETGVTIKVTGVAGVYSDPAHRQAYPGGEVRQVLAVCFHGWPVAGEPRPDGRETRAVAWVGPERLRELPMHPAMRLRLDQALAEPDTAHIG